MTNGIATLRRHLSLFEQDGQQRVLVRVDKYVDIHDTLPEADPIPTTFYFDYARDLGRDEMTAAVKADLLAATGYEPLRFRWRYLT